MNDDEWSEENRRYQETLPLFERSDPPVWWEGGDIRDQMTLDVFLLDNWRQVLTG